MKTITIHNVETGEVIERDMNVTELAQSAADKAEGDTIKAAKAKADDDKAALLVKLGITVDEARLLLS